MRRECRGFWFGACCAMALGCQQQMADQPAYRPLEASSFFADGRSARPRVAGTVARGQLDDERYAFARFGDDARKAFAAAALVGLSAGPLIAMPNSSAEMAALASCTAEFPGPVAAETLRRGQQRFTIFCAVCHGPDGGGQGPVVKRGFTRPPAFATDPSRGFRRRGWIVPLRDVPVGYYVAVMTEGYGAMASYAAQVPLADRWAIAAYIRALQLSQHADLKDLPDGARRAALDALEGEK